MKVPLAVAPFVFRTERPNPLLYSNLRALLTGSRTWLSTHELATHSWLQLGAGVLLACYPWAHIFGRVPPDAWSVWVMGVGLHAVWLLVRPVHHPLLPLASLGVVLGLCVVQAVAIFTYVAMGYPQLDYHLLASWISVAARDLSAAPQNIWFYNPPTSYLGTYFDPLVPLIDRVAHLTESPFRLMGFQAAAILSASVVTWGLSIWRVSLRPFQVLLPTALLLHPSVDLTLQADYHTSGIGLALLLLGSYLFFARLRGPAFILLLLGTLTKISYWPSWMMFGVLHVARREWRWAAAYGATGILALGIHQAVEAGHPGVGLNLFFPDLGRTPLEVLTNLILHPERWAGLLVDPQRWSFFGELLLPLGFIALSYPAALFPVLPLAVFSMLDVTGFRRMVQNVYATEYLGFLLAAGLIGLERVGRTVRLVALVALALGLSVTFSNPARWAQWNATLATATMLLPAYNRTVAFTECAMGSAPVVTTSAYFPGYVRRDVASVWVDTGKMTIPDWRWDQFGLLVYPANPSIAGSLTRFPNVGDFDVDRYRALMARLPVAVTLDDDPWDYRFVGGQQLVDCANRFGLRAEVNSSAS